MGKKGKGHGTPPRHNKAFNKRRKMLDDETMRYVYSEKQGILHDKACVEVSFIKDEDLRMLPTFKQNMGHCRRCYRQALIRNIVNIDDKTGLGFYDSFFKEASIKNLESLCLNPFASVRNLAPKVVHCHVNDDGWVFDFSKSTPVLMHNNYIFDENKERLFTGKYHPQKGEWSHINRMIRYALDYSWEDHVKAFEEAERERTMPIWKKVIRWIANLFKKGI